MNDALCFSRHCKDRMRERGFDEGWVQQVVLQPDQTIDRGKRTIYHRRCKDTFKNKEYLLRVFVEDDGVERKVVSVYRTSKIMKYWRQEK